MPLGVSRRGGRYLGSTGIDENEKVGVTKTLEIIEGLQYNKHSQISLTFPGEMWL
jgi:hypothetical protein